MVCLFSYMLWFFLLFDQGLRYFLSFASSTNVVHTMTLLDIILYALLVVHFRNYLSTFFFRRHCLAVAVVY